MYLPTLDRRDPILQDASVRASEHARERAADLLRRRCEEGYLSLDTFERRLEEVYRAKEVEQLLGLTADLPAVGIAGRFRQWRVGHRVRFARVPAEGVRLPLELVGDRAFILGRSRSCDVVLSDDTVSRSHAVLRRTAEGWSIRDLGSSNGTWVNGEPIERTRIVVPGDAVVLGGCLVNLM